MVTVSAKNTDRLYLKGNTRAWVEYVECKKTDNCPLYAEGKCACWRYLIGRNLTCPNAEWHRKEGYTKRSSKFYDFVDEVNNNYKPTAIEYKDKISVVADYVFLPINYLTGCMNKLDDVVNDHFVPIDKFNADFVEKIIKFSPRSWFNQVPIMEYNKKELPVFVQQLKEEMPLIYGKWVHKYPETAEKYKNLSSIGRTAYVNTLPDGSLGNGWYKKGDELYNIAYKNILFDGSFNSRRELEVRVGLEPDMTIKVTDKILTDENTKYVD